MPAHRKPAELRADNSPGRQRFELVPGEKVLAPEAPSGLLAITKRSWVAFWESDLSRVVNLGSDLPALVRKFQIEDEIERCYRGFRKARLVEGSKGQPVLNALGEYMLRLGAELRQLDDRFGCSPKARANLSLDFGRAKRTLEDVNRDLDDSDDTSDDPDLAALDIPVSKES